MATPKESKSTKTGTRKVKNPETFRERAVKASAQEAVPGRGRRIATTAGKPIGSVRKGASKLAKMRFFKILAVPFRFIGKILVPSYIRNSYKELRLVKWPNWRESRQLTFAVLAFAVTFAIFVAIVDYGLDKLFRGVLLK